MKNQNDLNSSQNNISQEKEQEPIRMSSSDSSSGSFDHNRQEDYGRSERLDEYNVESIKDEDIQSESASKFGSERAYWEHKLDRYIAFGTSSSERLYQYRYD